MGPTSPGSGSSKALAQASSWTPSPQRARCPVGLRALSCSRSGLVVKPLLTRKGIWMRVRARMLLGCPQAKPRGVTRTDRQLGGGNIWPVLGICDRSLHWQAWPLLAHCVFVHGRCTPQPGTTRAFCAARELVVVYQKPKRPSRVHDEEVCRATLRPAVVMRCVGRWACPGAVLASLDWLI